MRQRRWQDPSTSDDVSESSSMAAPLRTRTRMGLMRPPACTTVILVMACVLMSCGSNHSQSSAGKPPTGTGVVAHVGGKALTLATLRHWMGILSPIRALPEPPRYTRCIEHEKQHGARAAEAGLRVGCEEQYLATQKHALSFLITLAWIEEESANLGLAGDRGTQHAVATAPAAFPGANREDLRLLEQAESNIPRLRAMVIGRQPAIAPSRIKRFFEEHERSFDHSEKRSFNIVEQLRSPGVGRRLISTLQRSGRTIASLIGHPHPGWGVAIHEVRDRPSHLATQPAAWRAIFSAQPHTLVGPVPLFAHFSILEVVRVLPAVRPSLVDVSGLIASRLKREEDARALDAFVHAWRKRWKEQTLCRASYSVEQCHGYQSAVEIEDPFTAHVILEGVAHAYLRD
jgi:hypothetical protein